MKWFTILNYSFGFLFTYVEVNKTKNNEKQVHNVSNAFKGWVLVKCTVCGWDGVYDNHQAQNTVLQD